MVWLLYVQGHACGPANGHAPGCRRRNPAGLPLPSDPALILCPSPPPLSAFAQVAEELDRSPGEVLKKLEDIRNRII